MAGVAGSSGPASVTGPQGPAGGIGAQGPTGIVIRIRRSESALTAPWIRAAPTRRTKTSAIVASAPCVTR